VQVGRQSGTALRAQAYHYQIIGWTAGVCRRQHVTSTRHMRTCSLYLYLEV
jgi:hypothetical protein